MDLWNIWSCLACVCRICSPLVCLKKKERNCRGFVIGLALSNRSGQKKPHVLHKAALNLVCQWNIGRVTEPQSFHIGRVATELNCYQNWSRLASWRACPQRWEPFTRATSTAIYLPKQNQVGRYDLCHAQSFSVLLLCSGQLMLRGKQLLSSWLLNKIIFFNSIKNYLINKNHTMICQEKYKGLPFTNSLEECCPHVSLGLIHFYRNHVGLTRIRIQI